MKSKVKICNNVNCESRINKTTFTVCVACGMKLGGIEWLDLQNEAEVEKRLHPEEKTEEIEEIIDLPPVQRQLIVVCPACGERIPYRVGLELCPNCEEFVGDEEPVREDEIDVDIDEENTCGVKALRSLDGLYRLELSGDWIKLGRMATGQEYFRANEKRKVCREHAILSKKDGEWFIAYCKPEERNYPSASQNPIFINQRMLEKDEVWKLQAGDRISLSELDTSDCMAAFFDVE